MDPFDTPRQRFWQELGQALYADVISAFARFGVQVSPHLTLTSDDSLYSYYDRRRCLVSLPAPNATTLPGKLMWCYYQNITGAESPGELTRFTRLALTRFAAHELTHHLRDYYRTETKSAWMEEQVANTVGTAYAQSRKDFTGDELEFLKAFLQRAKSRLHHLAPTEAVTSSYSELERILADQGLLSEAELEDARAFARASRGELRNAVLAARAVPFEALDTSLRDQRAAQEYFNAHYMVNLVEYLRFQFAWFLADLQRPPIDLGEALQGYILTGDAGTRHRRESVAFLTTQLFTAPGEAAELAAWALSQEAPDEAEPILRAALEQREPAVAGAALAALVTIVDPSATSILCTDAARGPSALAARVAEVWHTRLSKTGPALALLRSLLSAEDPLPALVVTARLGLVELAPEVVDLLARLPDTATYYRTADAAWQALARFAPAPSLPPTLVRRGLRSGASSVRAAAVRLASLSALPNQEWARLLDDPSPSVRSAAKARLEGLSSDSLQADLHARSRQALSEAFELMNLKACLQHDQEVWSRLVVAVARERALTALRLGTVTHSLPSGFEHALRSSDAAAHRFAVKIIATHFHDLAAFWERESIESGGTRFLSDSRHNLENLVHSTNPLIQAVLIALAREKGIHWLETAVVPGAHGRCDPEGTAPSREDSAAPGNPMVLTAVERIVFLKTVPLFADVPTEELLAVAGSLVLERYQAGERVCTQHDPGDALYIVMEGHLIAQHEEFGQPPVTVNEFGPGDCVGEMAVLDGEPRSATVVCVEDSALLRLSGDRFRELGENHPDLLFSVLANLSRRLRATTRLAAERV